MNKILESTMKVPETVTCLEPGFVRDGGSVMLTFSDGFHCMFNLGLGDRVGPSYAKFCKSWQDRDVIELEQKYKDALVTRKDDFIDRWDRMAVAMGL